MLKYICWLLYPAPITNGSSIARTLITASINGPKAGSGSVSQIRTDGFQDLQSRALGHSAITL